jgi:GNAT superfamily N-acetyltransferase
MLVLQGKGRKPFMLRPYSKKYFDACAELFVAAFSAPPLSYTFLTREKTRRYLRDIVNAPGFAGFVYVLENETVAFCFGVTEDYFHAPQYDIKEFAVTPSLHGKGIGSVFLKEIENRLRGNGVTALTLQTSRAIPACSFYKKNGFSESEETVNLMKLLI